MNDLLFAPTPDTMLQLRASAGRACALLKAMANEDRLLLLCQLAEAERNVGELQLGTGIVQPTLSQQLGVLRDEGLVETRREGKFIYYRLASAEVLAVMQALYTSVCGSAQPQATAGPGTQAGGDMTIDWANFTPWSALAGGALIGLAAAIFMALAGRIAGISGVLGGLVGRSAPGDRLWRVMFVAGLLLAVPIWRLARPLPGMTVDSSVPVLIAAGLLVGVGTRYAAGCTSGHGVCGLSRGSPRSMAATAAFMAAGFVTVWLLRHGPAGLWGG